MELRERFGHLIKRWHELQATGQWRGKMTMENIATEDLENAVRKDTRKDVIETLEPLLLMSASGVDAEQGAAIEVHSALIFDLDKSGELEVTGETTAQDKSGIESVGLLVEFDIDGDGTLEAIEWIDGTGDGILIDASKVDGDAIDGSALIGTDLGDFSNGYEQLAVYDVDGNGLVETAEFADLKLWVDDGDAKLESGELTELADHLIFSISTRLNAATSLMQSLAFLMDDSEIKTESVWLGSTGDVVEDASDEETQEPPNEPPLAIDDQVTTPFGSSIQIGVLNNDNDPDGDPVVVLSFAQPAHGTVVKEADGRLTYTPDEGFYGVDYFVYVITDGELTSTATVRVNVAAPPADGNPPSAPAAGSEHGLAYGYGLGNGKGYAYGLNGGNGKAAGEQTTGL